LLLLPIHDFINLLHFFVVQAVFLWLNVFFWRERFQQKPSNEQAALGIFILKSVFL